MDPDPEEVMEQTEQLVKEMLKFLDSSSDEEDKYEDQPSKAKTTDPKTNSVYEDEEEEDGPPLPLAASVSLVGMGFKKNTAEEPTLAKEMSQIDLSKAKEDGPSCKRLSDSVWRRTPEDFDGKGAVGDDIFGAEFTARLEQRCRRRNDPYLDEVQRAIYGSTYGQPINGSADYFKAAENYAIYGKEFTDFPQHTSEYFDTRKPPPTIGHHVGAGNTCGPMNLYPTQQPSSASGGMTFLNRQSSGVGLGVTVPNATNTTSHTNNATANALYNTMYTNMQTNSRTTSGASSSYNMYMGNKVYLAGPPPTQSLLYNQHTSTTTNFISNNLANAALAIAPQTLYSNPLLATTSQQFLNTVFKETQYSQYLSSSSLQQSTTINTTTSIFERLVYAHMLQQQILQQTHQQAAAVAAYFQHKTPRTNRAVGLSSVGLAQSTVTKPSGSLNISGAGSSAATVNCVSGTSATLNASTSANNLNMAPSTSNMAASTSNLTGCTNSNVLTNPSSTSVKSPNSTTLVNKLSNPDLIGETAGPIRPAPGFEAMTPTPLNNIDNIPARTKDD